LKKREDGGHQRRAGWEKEDAKEFRIGHREVRFSYFDIALLTVLPTMGKSVVLKKGEDAREVEQLLLAAMKGMLKREMQKRRGFKQTAAYIGIMWPS